MQPKFQIRTTAYVVSFLWSLAVAFNGLHLSTPTSRLLGFIPLALVLAFTAYDKYLWHLRPQLIFAKRPDIQGTWIGSFSAEWLGDNENINHTDGPAVLVIKQTFTQTSIVLIAEKSKSYSFLSHIRQHDSGVFSVNYEYSNTPLLKFRGQLPVHSGSATLEVSSIRPRMITGEYWTNRMSRGTLEMSWISKRRAADLSTALGMTHEIRKGGS